MKAGNFFIKILLPVILAAGILWWMYRGIQWNAVHKALMGEMSWTWMLLSMPFGVLAQVLRAFRWKQVLTPLHEHPRLHTCMCAIFLSYASSLLIPRVGEFLRCGVLSRYEGTSFSRSVGTVVTERVIDTFLILLLSFFTVLTQIPVFLLFARRTDVSIDGFMSSFTTTGYIVTGICGFLLLVSMGVLIRRVNVFSKSRAVLSDLYSGVMSVRKVQNPILFVLYSVGIWVSYYLHFYLTFYCFDYTEGLGMVAALVAFVVGTFAVLVPTPNGAGPWHFAVKTILVLYGIKQVDGAVFVLIVHTLQTLLVLFLGLYALVALSLTARRQSGGGC